ncbi:hypothetical protein EII31_06995 [Leucobacter sp. OH2974_COT-288]|nr:hypothetical protein EII31_06995 [Leucobacter sp. OH2974_COT-288]
MRYLLQTNEQKVYTQQSNAPVGDAAAAAHHHSHGQTENLQQRSLNYSSPGSMKNLINGTNLNIRNLKENSHTQISNVLARNHTNVIDWWRKRRNKANYQKLLNKIVPPAMIITGCNYGALRASTADIPEVIIQRCLFHVRSRIKQLITLHPKTQNRVGTYKTCRLCCM